MQFFKTHEIHFTHALRDLQRLKRPAGIILIGANCTAKQSMLEILSKDRHINIRLHLDMDMELTNYLLDKAKDVMGTGGNVLFEFKPNMSVCYDAVRRTASGLRNAGAKSVACICALADEGDALCSITDREVNASLWRHPMVAPQMDYLISVWE